MNLAYDPYELASEAAKELRALSGIESIDLALTLGSGWKDATQLLGEEIFSVEASKIPGFSASPVAGHSAKISIYEVSTALKKHRVLVLGARTHYYEGKGVAASVHNVRVASAYGAKAMVLTNGCGGVREDLSPGSAVLISDHINFTGASVIDAAKFIDQSEVYSKKLRSIAKGVDPSLSEGVYMQFRGPFYESPAEVRMARTMGADLVGMSTVLEAMAAAEAGLAVLGFSLVTNFAAGISPKALNHEEVIEAGLAAAPKLAKLLSDTVLAILDQAEGF